MSVDKAIRDMVASEMARALAPVHQAISQLQSNGAVLNRIASALGQPVKRGPGRPPKAATFELPAVTQPVKRGPGRPPKALSLGAGTTAPRRGRPPRSASADVRMCAVIGCGRPARSKGFCAAHYQKFRMLERTGRLPSDWVADANPNSVQNITLPRGRAGAKALAEAKKK